MVLCQGFDPCSPSYQDGALAIVLTELRMVLLTGLEPARLSAPDPKSGGSSKFPHKSITGLYFCVFRTNFKFAVTILKGSQTSL